MNRTIEHRGPDEGGLQLFISGHLSIGLAHQRLSIVDLATGRQPMANEDETVWITYNGEIYNHGELRNELRARGHQYRTQSDTETVIHAYEEWGPECVQRFQGMFAFVIWDQRDNTMFGARDRLGIKPFYYAPGSQTLICASEVKAILESGWIDREVNLAALPEYVTFGYGSGEESLLRGVKKLMPGHWLRWKDGALDIRQYWDVPDSSGQNGNECTEQSYVDQFTRLFRQSVKRRLMADVPLGVFLSGGLDSSSIAAVMAEMVDEPVKTFSVGFARQGFNEFSYARQVANELKTDHHEITLTPDEFISSLPKCIWHEDAPIHFSSCVPLYHVARLAREHVKVVLTGEGSDELFAGYDKYWALLLNLKMGPAYERMLPRALRNGLIRGSLWHWPLPLRIKKKLGHTFLNHSMRSEEIIFDNFYSIFPRRVHSQLFAPELLRQMNGTSGYDNVTSIFDSRHDSRRLERLLYTDQKSYLLELLVKQDKMSMAASIESRVPFLDHEIVEFAAGVPEWMKLRGTGGKYIVKQAFQRILPPSILQRKKMGFPVPTSEWFRERYQAAIRQVLQSESFRERGLFNVSFINQLLDQHTAGSRDHGPALWGLLNLELWSRIFLDQRSPSDVSDELAGQRHFVA